MGISIANLSKQPVLSNYIQPKNGSYPLLVKNSANDSITDYTDEL